MRNLLTSVLAVAVLATAGPVFAQPPGVFGPEQGEWETAFAVAARNDRDFDRGRVDVDFHLGYYVTRNLLLGLRQEYGWDGGTNVVDTWVASTRAVADWHFDLAEWRPFVGVNFGYRYGDMVRDTWTVGPQAGLKWYLKQHAFVFGRVEYETFFRRGRDIDEGFRNGNFIYTIGIGLNF